MKKFTVKDFITYNAPCFNCDSRVNFYFTMTQDISETSLAGSVDKRAMVTTSYTEVELIVHYAANLKIKIDHKTNKFTTSSPEALTKYLSEHKLCLSSRCSKCYADIRSTNIEFNIEKGFVYPVSISSEIYTILGANIIYYVKSLFENKDPQTYIDVANIRAEALRLKIPLLPIYKFKTKDKFLNKMKIYTLFS